MKIHSILIIFLLSCIQVESQEQAGLFNEGLVVIRGAVKNPVENTIQFQLDEISGRRMKIAELDSNGYFETSFQVYGPHDNLMIYNGDIITLFLSPNDTVIFNFDGNNPEKTIHYEGANAALNNAMITFFSFFAQRLGEDRFFQKKKNLSAEEFYQFTDFFFKKLYHYADSISLQYQLDQRSAAWLYNYILYRRGEDVIEQAAKNNQSINLQFLEQADTSFTKYKTECAQYFDDFIGNYYYRNHFKNQQDYASISNEFRNISFTALDKTLTFIRNHVNDTTDRNILLTRRLHDFLERDYLIVDSVFKTHEDYITDITARNLIHKMLENKKKFAGQLLTLNDLQEQKPLAEIFTEISRENMGKVIFLDVWAIWCGGCINAFPASKALYESLDKNQVEFIYLCLDSPEEKWQNIINQYNLPGKHYLLNDDQQALIRNALNISGLPRYLIIDQNGSFVTTRAPSPHEEELKKQLMDLVEM